MNFDIHVVLAFLFVRDIWISASWQFSIVATWNREIYLHVLQW